MALTHAQDLEWFEKIYKGVDETIHKGLVFNQPKDWKDNFLNQIMPTIMSAGRERYSCRGVLHPTMTCKGY